MSANVDLPFAVATLSLSSPTIKYTASAIRRLHVPKTRRNCEADIICCAYILLTRAYTPQHRNEISSSTPVTTTSRNGGSPARDIWCTHHPTAHAVWFQTLLYWHVICPQCRHARWSWRIQRHCSFAFTVEVLHSSVRIHTSTLHIYDETGDYTTPSRELPQ